MKYLISFGIAITLYFAYTNSLLLHWVVGVISLLVFILLWSSSISADSIKQIFQVLENNNLVLKYLNVEVNVKVSDKSKIALNQFDGWVDVFYQGKPKEISAGVCETLNSGLWIKIPKGYELLLDIGVDLNTSTLLGTTIRHEYDNNRPIVVNFISFTNFVLKDNSKILRFRILPTMLKVSLDGE